MSIELTENEKNALRMAANAIERRCIFEKDWDKYVIMQFTRAEMAALKKAIKKLEEII